MTVTVIRAIVFLPFNQTIQKIVSSMVTLTLFMFCKNLRQIFLGENWPNQKADE